MTRKCKLILLSMYDIPEDIFHIIPEEVIEEIEKIETLCIRAGGNLVSRQIIADIIARVDTREVYNTNDNIRR
jgi:F0F1-type ATP synthase membrane subunit a